MATLATAPPLLPETPTAPAVLADYFTREELAPELGITVRTLARWDVLRIGPPKTKLGHKTLYKRTSVIEWIASRELKSVRPHRAARSRRGKA
jgi:hypothetical protein